MEHTCPHCGVTGDFSAPPEFPPLRVQCGNCHQVSPYIRSLMDCLLSEEEDFPGQINAIYMRPRWRTKPGTYAVGPLPPPPEPPFLHARYRLRRLLREHFRSLLSERLQRKTVRGLIDELRYGELTLAETKIIRQILAAKNHFDFNKRETSDQRRERAQRRHGTAKGHDGRRQSWRSR